MIRIPMANEKTARIELRSVAPDANPYLVLYTMLKTGFEGVRLENDEAVGERVRFLPSSINEAIALFHSSKFIADILGEDSQHKFVSFKQSVADRSPQELGTMVKAAEVLFHHEVTNQMLWNQF
jgi:glutamine synthetase